MGFKEFQIVLDSPVYYAGQNVTGKLLVDLKKPKKMKGLYVKYFGKGLVQWKEGWGTTMVSYTNTEIYLTTYQLVFGNGTDECVLDEGKHVFDLDCLLPPDLPCSFEGIFGHVKYSLRVAVDRPWKNDYITKERMNVMSIFDLHNCPVSMAPLMETKTKTFWGNSKPLSMTVQLPIRGYVPGQIIPIKVSLNNESEVQVKSLAATLKQNVIFHATRKSNPVKVALFGNEYPVQEGSSHQTIILNLRIPAVPPSYLQFCNLIDLRYQLNVKAKVNGCHSGLKIPMEVIIGNIPVISHETPSFDHQLSNLSLDLENLSYCDQASPRQPPPYSVIFPSAEMYKDLPPPSYEQSSRPERSEKDNSANDEPGEDGEEERLAPWYPLYKFEN